MAKQQQTPQIDLNAIAQAAMMYNIPPAILNALYQAKGSSLGISQASMLAVGGQLDPTSTLAYAAQLLSQSFGRNGNWESALSDYLTGNPQAYTSPTSSVGGDVYGILGNAAVNPTLGMNLASPTSANHFSMAAAGFGMQMADLMAAGGAISSQHVQNFMSQIDRIVASTGRSLFNGHAAGGLQNIYPWGQCTWGALAMAPWLGKYGNFGNAADWINSAQRKGLPVTNTPQVGSVVSFNGNFPGSQGDGHVGVVTSVGPNGTFTYASVNWGGLGNTHVGTSTMAYVNGFIPAPNQQAAQEAVSRANQIMAGQMPTDTPQTQSHSYSPQQQQAMSAPKHDPTVAAPVAGLPQNGPGNPKQIGEFAAQLQAANIDPKHFAANFPFFAGMWQKYMQQPPNVSQFAAASAAGALSQSALSEYIRQQPHPKYPEVQVGKAIDTWNHAALHSVLHTNSTPSMAEAVRMAQANWGEKEMSQYYQNKAAQQANETPQPQQKQGGPR